MKKQKYTEEGNICNQGLQNLALYPLLKLSRIYKLQILFGSKAVAGTLSLEKDGGVQSLCIY